jgi:hypothetical protein
MSIKLLEEGNEVYFKKTTNYNLEVDGKPLTIRIEEDSNEGRLYYEVDGQFTETPPDWIIEMGEDDWGDLNFERTIWEAGLSSCVVGDELEVE